MAKEESIKQTRDMQTPGLLDAGIGAILSTLRHVFALLSFAIVGLIVWYFTFGGAFTVEEQEKVLVMRFGRLQHKPREPGWNWTWPYPICEIVRIPVNRQTLVTYAFWFHMDPARPSDQEGPAAAAQPLAPGKGGYLFTGDTNIVHSGWGMFYRVSDPYKYYTSSMGPADPRGMDNMITNPDTGERVGTRGPHTMLRAAFENAVIKATSKENVDFVLRSPDYIGTIEKAVMLAVANADIGVTVESVWLNKPRTPPLAAAQAFLDVFDASNFSFSERERARAYAIKSGNEGASEAVRIVADAEAYKTRVVSGIEADTKYFKAMLVEYRKNPDMVLISRYSEVLGDVLKMTDDKFVIRTNKKGSQEVRLLLNREPPKKEEVKEE